MELDELEKELEFEEEKRNKSEEKKEITEIEERKKEIFSKVVEFTNRIRKLYGDLIKSVLIFGSFVRGDIKKTSDVDVWVILDDTATKSSEDLEKVTSNLYLISQELKDLHIQVTPLTEFWNWIKSGSPELVNFLRYGLPIYDTGFVKPVQRMLQMGLIPPSEETIKLKAKTAEARIKKAKLDIGSMIFDLRYAAIDMIQAVVMYFYKEQPDAKAIPKFLERLVKEKKIERRFITMFSQLDKLWKDIDHKIIEEPSPSHLKKALEISEKIIKNFKKLLPPDIRGER